MASIEKRDGRWRVRYRVGAGRGSKQRSESFRTLAEARSFAAQVQADLDRGRLTDPGLARQSFSTYAKAWEKRAATRGLRASTLAQYRLALRLDLIPHLGDLPLGNIRAGDLDAVATTLRRRGLAQNTVRQRCLVAVMVLRAAVREGVLPASPAESWRLPRAQKRELVVFTPAEVRRLLDAATGPSVKRWEPAAVMMTPTLVLAVFCGLRQGELLGLRWEDVDFLRRELHVRRQVTGPLKTDAARRVLPMPALVVDTLAAYAEQGSEGWLFTTPRSRRPYRSRSDFNDRVWKPLLERAGLDSGYGMHALRHTYASLLIDEGLHPKVVQERLGHASIAETMATYSHLFPHAQAQTRTALDSAISKITEPSRARGVPGAEC